MCPGRSMVRRRSHSCGVERAAADAACSPVALRGGPTQGIAPSSISAVHTGVLKTSAVAMRSWVDVLRTFFRRTRHSLCNDRGTCKPLKTQRRRGDRKRRSNARSPGKYNGDARLRASVEILAGRRQRRQRKRGGGGDDGIPEVQFQNSARNREKPR